MDDSWKHDNKEKKPETKDHVLYDCYLCEMSVKDSSVETKEMSGWFRWGRAMAVLIVNRLIGNC